MLAPTHHHPSPPLHLRTLLTLCLVFVLTAGWAEAQVVLDVRDGLVTIQNAGSAPQTLTRLSSKSGTDSWVVGDNVGNHYGTSSYEAGDGGGGGNQTGGSGGTSNDPIIVVMGGYESGGGGGGNQTGGSGGTSNDPIIVVMGGYESALDLLRGRFGATATHDATLNVDVLSLPATADIDAFFRTLVTDSLHGYPLYRFLGMLEIASRGTFDEPAYDLAKTAMPALPFPNDPLYWEQWGLRKTRIGYAQWHTALANHQVRIAVIDSGVGDDERANTGLDGAAVEFVQVAPTSGRPAVHGLGLLSLLADRSHDGDGIVGMVGNWGSGGCYANAPLFQSTTPQVISYSVGDYGPISVYVARAIRLAVEAGVDVINLSMRMGYSPAVETAIQEALDANVIVVAAAGNYAPGAAHKPAAFPANIDGVIAVGAADESMGYAALSANEGVDILAPGEHVVIGGPGNIWYYGSGTSFAAPYVTATAAMIRAVRPDLTAAEIVEAMQVRAQAQDQSGVGFLNALSSLNAALNVDERQRYLTLPHECVLGGLGKDNPYGWTEVDTYDHAQDDDLFPDETLETAVPEVTALGAPRPNPFASRTTLVLDLAEAQPVRVYVYNTLGQRVAVLADGTMAAGQHPLTLDAANLPSGLYLVRLETETGVTTQTVTLTR